MLKPFIGTASVGANHKELIWDIQRRSIPHNGGNSLRFQWCRGKGHPRRGSLAMAPDSGPQWWRLPHPHHLLPPLQTP